MVSTLCTVSLVQPAVPCCASPCQAQHQLEPCTRMHTRAHTHTYVRTCAERLPHAQTPCTQHLSNTQRAHTYAHTDLENTCPMEHTQSCMCTHTDNTHVCAQVCISMRRTCGHTEHMHAKHTATHGEHAGEQHKPHCSHPLLHPLCSPAAPTLGAARWGSGPYHPHSLSTEGG